MVVVHFRETNTTESEVYKIEYDKTEATEPNSLLVNSIPNPDYVTGKSHKLFIRLADKSLYYKYEPRPLTQEEEIKALEAKTDQAIIELTMLMSQGGTPTNAK